MEMSADILKQYFQSIPGTTKPWLGMSNFANKNLLRE
jgi:hypothetical protein